MSDLRKQWAIVQQRPRPLSPAEASRIHEACLELGITGYVGDVAYAEFVAALPRPMHVYRDRPGRWIVYCRLCGVATDLTPTHAEALESALWELHEGHGCPNRRTTGEPCDTAMHPLPRLAVVRPTERKERAVKSLNYGDEAANFGRMLDMVNVKIIARFTIMGDPNSKARPRFSTRGGKPRTYTPQATIDAESKIAAAFREAAPEHQPDKTHSYGLSCVFFSQTFQRRDVDNMLKLVSDGLNGVAWDDDSQVYEVTGRRGLDDPANARTEVLIYRMGKLWNPTRDCEWCGGPFKVYRSTARSGQRFCSRDCSNASRRKRRMNTCPNCGKEYEGHSGNRKGVYCSMACASEASRVELDCLVCAEKFTQVRSWISSNVQVCSRECLVEYRRQRPPKHPKGKCIHCGGATSRKEYTRCAACRTEQRVNKRDLRKKVA